MNNIYTSYVRKAGRKCGVVLFVDTEEGLKFGWSKFACNRECPHDYDKKLGKEIAFGRVRANRPYVLTELPYLVQQKVAHVLPFVEKRYGKQVDNLCL